MTPTHGNGYSVSGRILSATFYLALLSGCGWLGSDDIDDKATGQAAEKAEAAATDDELVKPVVAQLGTPMAERVATLGFLNKRNGLTRDLELRPGQSIRIGRAIVRLRACEKTAPWELTPEHGAFVQLLVNDRPSTRLGSDNWDIVFSGWLFRESPSLNVVEHPIYDVWVKSCAMSFPGEEAPAPDDGATDPTAPRPSPANEANNVSSAENDGDSPVSAPAAETAPTPAPTSPSTPEPAPGPRPPAPTAPAPDSGPADLIGELITENDGGG